MWFCHVTHYRRIIFEANVFYIHYHFLFSLYSCSIERHKMWTIYLLVLTVFTSTDTTYLLSTRVFVLFIWFIFWNTVRRRCFLGSRCIEVCVILKCRPVCGNQTVITHGSRWTWLAIHRCLILFSIVPDCLKLTVGCLKKQQLAPSWVPCSFSDQIVLDTGLSKIRRVEFAVSIPMMVFAGEVCECVVIVKQKNAL